VIASGQKPLKWYRGLTDKKRRLENRAFLVEGEKAISQVAASHPGEILEILSVAEPPPLFRRYPLREVEAGRFRHISAAQTPQGIAAVVRLPENVYGSSLPENAGNRILLLEDVQDPGNVGTLIRTAAAFDFSGAILTKNSADPFSPKVVQAAAGTVLSLWLRKTAQYLDIIKSLKQSGYTIIAADVRGNNVPSSLPGKEKLVLALGNEAAGLSKELLNLSDYRVRIPTPPEKAESLNVAVSGAILMYLSTVK